MKKTFVAIILIVGFGGYIYWSTHTSAPTANPVSDVTPTEPIPTVPTDASNNPNNAPVSSGAYKDGTFTGAVASTIYGDVQVAAVISKGKIVDVKMLKYPNDRENSRAISDMSFPILKQEAITAQNAHVDIVSGATQTTEGFQQSLGSALAQAQA